MKTFFPFLAMLIFATIQLNAQQALWGGTPIISPEVNSNKTVTFRFQAPNADSVFITGDFLPTAKYNSQWGEIDIPGRAMLVKDNNGTWSFTSAVLEPNLYSYSFIVDGLITTDPNNVYKVRDVASVFDVFIVDGGVADLYKVNQVPHGSVTRCWYNSPTLEKQRRITIYTPPGYENNNEKYPVLYLLHGMGGDEEAWIALGRTAQIIDNLIAQGKAQPMIVVMPNGNAAQEAAPGESSLGMYKPTMQLPNTMDGTYENSFKDIISFVENNYRVKAEKSCRAIAGLSMGGFHSLHISRFYPNTFDYVGLFSAAIMPDEKVKSKVYENFDETLSAQMNNGVQLYWIGIGKTDFLYQANVDYRKKLDSMGFKYMYIETEGGHTWDNWRKYLSEFATQIFPVKKF
ncbi:MAG: esterase [Prolixibacteraceae bacterium]|nr:esterase [Prolixibacteraceae bacterium]